MLRIGVALAAITAAYPAAAAPSVSECAALQDNHVESGDISLPTRGATILSAAMVDDGAGSRFCKVLGAIHPVAKDAPDIRFQVNLPAAWNHKALHIGGGRANGYLVTAEAAIYARPGTRTPLQQGYATFGSDSGHQTGPDDDQVAFGLNLEARQNFAGDQLKKTRDVAVALIRRVYREAPRRMYFQGGSQGGGEAMKVLQRWPGDYSGIVAIHPLYNFTAVHVTGVALGQAVYNTPGAWISPAQGAMVTARVVARCDGLDGLTDGIVGNVQACTRAFDPKVLRCTSGTGSDGTCLSDPQLRILQKLSSDFPIGLTLAGGVKNYGRWPVFQGGLINGFFNPFGRAASPQRPPRRGDSYPLLAGDGVVRYMLMEDVNYDSLGFVAKDHRAKVMALSRQMDASDADISTFRQRGGKLLLLHGTIDMAVPPNNTIAYWQRLQRQFGGGLGDFAKFYFVPGFGHNEGPFKMSWDSLGTLDAWVDRGISPGPQTIADTNEATQGRTRPLCEYPAYPRYRGMGDVNVAASFDCARP